MLKYFETNGSNIFAELISKLKFISMQGVYNEMPFFRHQSIRNIMNLVRLKIE
jgi:hypothetical protein